MNRYIPHMITSLSVALLLAQGLSGGAREKATIKEIGILLKEKGYQGSVIMGPKKYLRLAFYSDGAFIKLPGSWEKTLGGIRQNGVKIIVMDPCTIEQECPGFLANWTRVGLFPLNGPVGRKEKCPIQIYVVR